MTGCTLDPRDGAADTYITTPAPLDARTHFGVASFAGASRAGERWFSNPQGLLGLRFVNLVVVSTSVRVLHLVFLGECPVSFLHSILPNRRDFLR